MIYLQMGMMVEDVVDVEVVAVVAVVVAAGGVVHVVDAVAEVAELTLQVSLSSCQCVQHSFSATTVYSYLWPERFSMERLKRYSAP